MSAEDEVRKASRQFYAALNRMLNGDATSLAAIWSHGPGVTTMHPIGGRQVGWNDVWGSWNQVSKVASDGKVELKDQLVRCVGDLAYELGEEHASFKLGGQVISGQPRVTNVYQREDGEWKMIHHHSDAAPAMIEAVSRLQPPSA